MTFEEIKKMAEETFFSFSEEPSREETKESIIQILRTTYNAGFAEGVKRAGQVQDFTLGKIFRGAKG